VGIDVASHVQSFLSKADLGVRMTGSEGSVLEEVTVPTKQHEVIKVSMFVSDPCCLCYVRAACHYDASSC
jgi:hypothetical protein